MNALFGLMDHMICLVIPTATCIVGHGRTGQDTEEIFQESVLVNMVTQVMMGVH